MNALLAVHTHELVPPAAVILIGLWAMFRLCRREEEARNAAPDCKEAPACTDCRARTPRMTAIDILLFAITLVCLVAGVLWMLKTLGIESNGYFVG